MNSLKVSLLVLSLLYAMPASASWLKIAKKAYLGKKILKAKKELARVQAMQEQVDIFEKMYSSFEDSFKKLSKDSENAQLAFDDSPQEQKKLDAYNRNLESTKEIFIEKQQVWALDKKFIHFLKSKNSK
jgi:hypothetical protein